MLTDFFAYLKADTTLRGLISGATAAEPRIYPEPAPNDTLPPYLVFGPAHEGSLEEIMDQMTIQISVFTAQHSVLEADLIIKRLKAILDLQDQIQGKITSDTYFIYWCKHIGSVGPGFISETREQHRAAMFALKFKLKT